VKHRLFCPAHPPTHPKSPHSLAVLTVRLFTFFGQIKQKTNGTVMQPNTHRGCFSDLTLAPRPVPTKTKVFEIKSTWTFKSHKNNLIFFILKIKKCCKCEILLFPFFSKGRPIVNCLIGRVMHRDIWLVHAPQRSMIGSTNKIWLCLKLVLDKNSK
jgi:hypothetical protein